MVARGFWASERNLSLLAALLLVSIFLVAPLAPPRGPGVALLAVTYFAILISGIATVARRAAAAVAISGVALLSGAAYFAALWAPGSPTSCAREILSGLYCILLSGVIFERIFRAGRVTVHRISGAVAAYLLIGVFFSHVYNSIELLAPGAFRAPSPGAPLGPASNPLAYFSFTTLTTVGYGDVTPVHPLARSLANLEALIGQLFPAILIARLVALEVSQQPDDDA